MERMKEFARRFKTQREKLGYSCGALAHQLMIRYGVQFTENKVAKFEAGQLDFQEMHSIKCYVECWLLDTVKAQGGNVDSIKELTRELSPKHVTCKKRTAIPKEQKDLLEIEFVVNPHPSASQLDEISSKLVMDKNVVRVWFCNRRQKVKRQQTKSNK